MRFSTIFTALFFPYISHEQTAQNLILSVRSSLFALFLIERHRSQNVGSLKSEEWLSDFIERFPQLWLYLTFWVGVGSLTRFITCDFHIKLNSHLHLIDKEVLEFLFFKQIRP